MAGRIIYFDGPDGVGKTEQLQLAAEALKKKGHDVYTTRSLGGTPIGEQLRLASQSDAPRPPETDLYIALACQYALAADILARRAKGQVVLVDRSPLSIIAYQVAGDGLNSDKGYQAVDELLGLIEPDLTIVYKAVPKTLEARRKHRNDHTGHDYFEKKPAGYHQKTAQGFETAAKHFAAKVIEAEDSSTLVHDATMAVLEAIF